MEKETHEERLKKIARSYIPVAATQGPVGVVATVARVDMRRLIRAQCPKCGEVALPATEVMLAWDFHDSTGDYAFTCPKCGLTYWDRAPMHVAITLVLAGASLDLRLPPISVVQGDDVMHGRGGTHMAMFHTNGG